MQDLPCVKKSGGRVHCTFDPSSEGLCGCITCIAHTLHDCASGSLKTSLSSISTRGYKYIFPNNVKWVSEGRETVEESTSRAATPQPQHPVCFSFVSTTKGNTRSCGHCFAHCFPCCPSSRAIQPYRVLTWH